MMTTWSAVPTLDRIFNEVAVPTPRRAASTFPIAADVHERSEEYALYLDVPGVKTEDLDIGLENRVLTVRGERRGERGPNERVTRGRPCGQFTVSFVLPDCIEEANLTADLSDGVLTIRVPKQAKAQPRKIPINSSADRTQPGD